MSGGKKRRAFKRFWGKLQNPPNWVAMIAFGATLVVCPLVILAMVLGYGHTMAATIACVICGLLFIYTTVVTVNYIVKFRRKVLRVANKFTFTRNLYKSYEFRTLFFGICAFLCNVGYTVFLIVMAFKFSSVWYGAIGLYYILLSVARGGILIQNGKDEKKYKYDFHRLQTAKVGTYRYCGIMMLVLAFSLGVSVVELVVDNSGFRLASWWIYVFAIVAAYKIFSALRHFIHATKRDDLVVRSVRYINLSVTLMSVLCLQTSIVAAFPPKNTTAAVINGVTGALVCLITLALGLYMVVFSVKEKRRLLAQEALYVETASGLEVGYNRDGYYDEYEELRESSKEIQEIEEEKHTFFKK